MLLLINNNITLALPIKEKAFAKTKKELLLKIVQKEKFLHFKSHFEMYFQYQYIYLKLNELSLFIQNEIFEMVNKRLLSLRESLLVLMSNAYTQMINRNKLTIDNTRNNSNRKSKSRCMLNIDCFRSKVSPKEDCRNRMISIGQGIKPFIDEWIKKIFQVYERVTIKLWNENEFFNMLFKIYFTQDYVDLAGDKLKILYVKGLERTLARIVDDYAEFYNIDQIIECQTQEIRRNYDSFKCIQEKMNETICIVCKSNPRDIVTAPCNHLVLCSHCSVNITTCPICRIAIEKLVQIVI